MAVGEEDLLQALITGIKNMKGVSVDQVRHSVNGELLEKDLVGV